MKHLLSTLVLAAAAIAQTPVCVTGVVQPVGPTICMQGETHMLADTQIMLRSQLVNLQQYVGQLVRVEGNDIGLMCRVLDVAAVAPAPATLESCGTPMPGCQMKFKVQPGAIGRYALVASLSPGFQPWGCSPPDWIDGSLLVGTPSVTLVVAMFPGPSGDYVWQIPNTPSLAGVALWFQGARQDIGPVGPVQLTNTLRVVLVPFMPPCGGIGC